MTQRKLLVADLLCGAGGTSEACEQAVRELGRRMELVCVNHWPTAIETHKNNHPKARHYIQDIATVRPHLIVPEGYLDLLTGSPTCTHHSVARGGKPTSDQQRSDPWHIITWLTELRVRRMIIENVWEFCGWGPVDPKTSRPIPSRKGEYFNAWIETIKRLGYQPEWRKLNAADYGEATTRQRFILMARNDRRLVAFPAPTHQRPNDGGRVTDLFALKPWRPAREIINWSRKGKSIFNRPVPLAPKTLERILAGALKFEWPVEFILLLLPELHNSLIFHIRRSYQRRNAGNATKRHAMRKRVRTGVDRLERLRKESVLVSMRDREGAPMVVTLRRNADGRPVTSPIPALAANGQHIALAQPIILANRTNNAPKDPETSPVPCATTATGGGVGVAEAVFINGRRGNQAKGVSSSPLPALDTKGYVWLAEPLVLSQHSSGRARSSKEPLPTIMTGGAAALEHPGCARPMLITVAHGNDADEKSPNDRRAKSIEEPLGAIHGDGVPYAVVEPFVLSRQGEGAPRVHSLDSPAPTPTATGHINLVEGTRQLDILFRMFEPDELGPAMGFPDDYRFAGTKTDQVKQIGNAVSIRKMKACVKAILADEDVNRKRQPRRAHAAVITKAAA